jgi:hypothetical protein
MPDCLEAAFKRAMMIKFDEKPDYSFFISALESALEKDRPTDDSSLFNYH